MKYKCNTCKVYKPISELFVNKEGVVFRLCVMCQKNTGSKSVAIAHHNRRERIIKRDGQNTKFCTHCNNFKSHDDFYTSGRNFNSLQSWCKDCTKQITIEIANGNHKTRHQQENERWTDGGVVKRCLHCEIEKPDSEYYNHRAACYSCVAKENHEKYLIRKKQRKIKKAIKTIQESTKYFLEAYHG